MNGKGIHNTLINIGWGIIAIGLFYYALMKGDWDLAWKWGLVGSFIQGTGILTFINWRRLKL